MNKLIDNKKLEDARIRYITGQENVSDRRLLWKEMNASDSFKQELLSDKRIWQLSQQYTHTSFSSKKRRGLKDTMIKIVAIACVTILSLFVGYQYAQWQNRTKHPLCTWRTISTQNQRTQLYLADGTHIWLNKNTTLSYPSLFSSKERLVKLRGEAFFNVTKDSLHPFVVNTQYQKVKVLGTQFNISAYDSTQITATTLVEGKIALTNGKQSIIMYPHTMACQDHKSKEFNIQPTNTLKQVIWKENEYSFSNQPLSDCLEVIECWYKIKIECSSEIQKLRFTGKLERKQSLSHYLKLLYETKNIEYKKNQNTVTLYK